MGKVIGFSSEDDFRRANRAIRAVEGERVNLVRSRGRWPVGGGDGGASLVPYIITKASESDPNVAVFRDLTPLVTGKKAEQPFVKWNVVEDAEDEYLDTTVMRGVVFTNQVVLVSTISRGGSAPKLKIVGGWCGEIFHDCEAVNEIAAGETGQIIIRYTTDVTLDLDGVIQEATVNAVNSLDRGLSEGQTLDLVTFSDAMQTFKIISASCG